MNILMISTYFAPCTIVGALRMTSLANYLLSHGNSVTVIKLAEASYDTGGLASGKRVEGATYVELTSNIEDWKSVNIELLQLIDKLSLSNHYDCCIATFGPFSTIPSIVSGTKKYHIPLVVDYRDLWVFFPTPTTTIKGKLIKWYLFFKYYGLEKSLMTHCAKFVSVTPRSVERMIHFYPFLKKKSHCIYNGYTDILGEVTMQTVPENFSIFFLGKLAYYSIEGTRFFFEAVNSLIQKGHSIRIVHIGKREPVVDQIMCELFFPEKVFVAEGQHPYAETIKMAQKADMFMAINRDPDGLETKIFDYIYLNKPIVAYGPADSEFSEMMRHGENAYMCQSKQQIEQAIETIIVERKAYFTTNMEFRKSLSRDDQNAKYLELLYTLKK